jgi:hypothetical protein
MRYWPSVTEMMYEQVPGIKGRYKHIADFEGSVQIEKKTTEDPTRIEYVLHIKELNDYWSYVVIYHLSSIKSAILHGAA